MYRITSLLLTLVLLSTTTHAQQRGLTFGGLFESSLLINNIIDDNDDLRATYGLEEYANIRMNSRVGESATFSGAVNLIAATGDYALRSTAMGASLIEGENYAAAIELERLHFKIKTEHVDFDAGLMRIPFGYGLAWRPSDFLNPPNPLNPNARPRAVIGGTVTHFPIEELKLQAFAAAGREALSNNSGLAGLSVDKHWTRGSVQLLYALEHFDNVTQSDLSNPEENDLTNDTAGIIQHRIGASVKADIEIGFVAEALYTYNSTLDNAIDGLALSAGFDYSILRGNLILLAEYLYNGAMSSTSINGGGNFANEHYAIVGATYRVSDFTNISLQLITDIDAESVIPMLTFTTEFAQGVTLVIMAQAPDVERHYLLETRLRLRF